MAPFVRETDHKTYLDETTSLSSSNRKLMRYLTLLLEFRFQIRHVLGKMNVVTDMLSRTGHGLIEPQAVHTIVAITSQEQPQPSVGDP